MDFEWRSQMPGGFDYVNSCSCVTNVANARTRRLTYGLNHDVSFRVVRRG